MAFVPTNPIEQQLVAAAKDPAARPQFYRGLLEAPLFIITEGRKPPVLQKTVLSKGESIEVRAINYQGSPHTPIFTSGERISAFVKENVGFVAMQGRALFDMLRGSDLIMNPGSEFGKVFTRDEVHRIVDGTIFQPDSNPDVGGKQILLGQPKDYPRHITDALAKLFAKHRQVAAAYIAHAAISGDPIGAHTLIGLELSDKYTEIAGEAGVVVQSVAKQGETIDFVKVEPNATDAIGKYMQGSTKPFYVRKKFLGVF